MDIHFEELIEKYGADSFFYMSQATLDWFIHTDPAPDDELWASLLCGSADATRRAVLSQMNRLRREFISQSLIGAEPISSEALYELFSRTYSYNGLVDCVHSDSPIENLQETRRLLGMGDELWAELFSFPMDLHTAKLEDIVSRWLLFARGTRVGGLIALEPLLDADWDETSMGLLHLAMRSPAGRGFDSGLSAIKEVFLAETGKKLDAIAATLQAIAKGDETERLKVEIEPLLGDEIQIPSLGSAINAAVPDGKFSQDMAQLLLWLCVNAKSEGILSLEDQKLRRRLQSSFLTNGLQIVVDGMDLPIIERWVAGRRSVLLEEAERKFNVVASACWSLAGRHNPRIAMELMRAQIPSEITEDQIDEWVQELKSKVADSSKRVVSLNDHVYGTFYGDSQADNSYADPLEWFELKAGLEQLIDDGTLPNVTDHLAKLAMSLPALRWAELEESSVLPSYVAKDIFAHGFSVIKRNEPPVPVGPYLMNLVQNLGLESSTSVKLKPELQSVLEQLSALNYWDALLLPSNVFEDVLGKLTAPQVNSLAHSGFGKRASELGLPFHKAKGEVVHEGASRYALLAELADLVVRGEWSPKEGMLSPGGDSIILFQKAQGFRPPKEWLVEKIEVDEDDFLAVNPRDCFTLSPYDGLFAITGVFINGCSLEDGIDIFRRLPLEALADILCCGVHESRLERINTLISSLDNATRFQLREKLSAYCKEYLPSFEAGLSLGFEEVMGLSDPYIREWLKAVSNEDLVAALARAPQEFTGRVLGNLTEGAAAMIAEDIESALPWLDPAEELMARLRIVEAAKAVDPECEARAAEIERELLEDQGIRGRFLNYFKRQ